MQKILAITDIHITEADKRIIGLDPLARFQQVLDAALHDHPDAAALILMGDLTHHGRPAQYERLAAALSDCPVPVISMVGNHDRRDAFLEVFTDAQITASSHVQAILDFPHHRVITLDTLDGPPYPPGHHSGRLCPERLAWLDDALVSAGDRIPLIFTHHPPFDTGIVGMDAIKLADGDKLLDRLAATPNAHLFCGHIHRTISGSVQGVPWTMFKSPCHQGALDLATPDSSLSLDEPGAYGLLLLHPSGVIAHSQDVGLDATIHVEGHSVSASEN